MTKQRFSVEQLRRRTAVVVGASAQKRVLIGVEGRLRRRQQVRRALTVGTSAVMLVGTLWGLAARKPRVATHSSPAPAQIAVVEAEPGLLRFDDRSTGRPGSEQTRTRVVERSAVRTVVALEAGAVSFDVVRGNREFRVQAGSVDVVVLGTAFLVDRQAKGVQVTVTRGHVRVENHGTAANLDVGDSRWFPFEPPSVAEPTKLTGAHDSRGKRTAAAVRWPPPARKGEFKRTDEMSAGIGEAPKDAVEDLLLATDVARRSNHFAEALAYYDRVIEGYRRDPRAPLAALTKGRIALRKLHDGKTAAEALKQARLLSLPDSLAEEALADEVEAWALAGDTERARAAATEYVRRYPSGTAIDRVRRLGLEKP